MNDVLGKVEERLAGVAGLHPGGETREVTAEFHKHGLAADGIERIGEIQGGMTSSERWRGL